MMATAYRHVVVAALSYIFLNATPLIAVAPAASGARLFRREATISPQAERQALTERDGSSVVDRGRGQTCMLL